METKDPGYSSPQIEDLGTLVQMTLAGEIQGFEDAGPKFSLLDVSGAGIP